MKSCLLSQVREHFGVMLPVQMFLPPGSTLPDLVAALNDSDNLCAAVPYVPAQVLQAASELPADLLDGAAIDLEADVPAGVLLTGATGFVGATTLYQLLQHHSGPIYTVIRGDNPANRLKTVMQRFGYWDSTWPVEGPKSLRVISAPVFELKQTGDTLSFRTLSLIRFNKGFEESIIQSWAL